MSVHFFEEFEEAADMFYQMTGYEEEPYNGLMVAEWSFEEVDNIIASDGTFDGYAVYDCEQEVMLLEARMGH